MKKKFAFVVALLLSGASLMAQKTVETIYLKNGSVIRGTVIEQVPGQSLKVQTKDGSVFVYQMNEVERITKEMPTNSGTSGKSGHRGLDFTMEGGVLFGGHGNAAGTGGIEIGKRFSEKFYWGAGIGIGKYAPSDYAAIPVTTTFKALWPIRSSKIVPNIAFRTGFDANTYGEDYSWEIDIMPGIQIPLGQKVDFNFNLGYQCGIGFNGGAGHLFAITAGFGFHKPYDRKEPKPTKNNTKPKVPTRDKGVQYGIEGAAGFGGSNVIHTGPALVLSYKMNPNLSVGLGYRFGFFSVDRTIEGNKKNKYNLYGDMQGTAHSFFLRGQYRLTDKKFSPFASVDIGVRKYNLEPNGDFNKEYKDYTFTNDCSPISSGFLFTPAVGASLRTTNNSYLEFKVGYNCTNGQKGTEGSYGSSKVTIKKAGFGDFFFSVGYTHTLKWFSNTK